MVKRILAVVSLLQFFSLPICFAEVTPENLEISPSSPLYFKGELVDAVIYAKNDAFGGSPDQLNFGPYRKLEVDIYKLTADGSEIVASKPLQISQFTQLIPSGKSVAAYVLDVTNSEQLEPGTYTLVFTASYPGGKPYTSASTFRIPDTVVVQAAKLEM